MVIYTQTVFIYRFRNVESVSLGIYKMGSLQAGGLYRDGLCIGLPLHQFRLYRYCSVW